MTVSMVVDELTCQGHGPCTREAPDVFALPDDLEHALVLANPIPEASIAAAQRAREACPEQAIGEVSRAHLS